MKIPLPTLLLCASLLLAAGCSSSNQGEGSAHPAHTSSSAPPSEASVTRVEDLAYGPGRPGNRLDLYLPDLQGEATLPLIIWHSGSGWFGNAVRTEAIDVAEEFTARGYAVASIDVRSSDDARFPAQGHDVRAAIRWLRENADDHSIDPNRFAFMGDSSGGWSAAFAATTSDVRQLPGEEGVDSTSSAVQVAVSFFPPTDFLSMDDFAAEHHLPMDPEVYPHDAPGSPEGQLIGCPGEGFPNDLVSIQNCPAAAEAADPSTYIEGAEIPVWTLHGRSDPLVPYNQSRLLYENTTDAGNQARFTLVPGAGHSIDDIIGAEAATTWTTNPGGLEEVTQGMGPSWDDIDEFLRANLGGDNAAPPAITPTPTPTPTFESPGPQDHPIAIAAVDDALLLVTMHQLERVGSATVWRSDSGGWQKLGTLQNAIPRHWKKDSDSTRLSPGPGPLDIVATEQDAHRVGFSRDGGATWSYLANPRECGDCWIEAHGDHLYAWDVHNGLNTLLQAPFGATGWEEVPLPPIPAPENGYTPPLVLEDGTLVVSEVTIDDHDDYCPDPYRVSRDHGDTWSGRREAPTGACIQGFVGNTLCASDVYAGREFRSTDLVHWEPVHGKPCFAEQPTVQDLPAACSRQDPAYQWVSDPPLAVGEEVFRLFHVDDRDPWRNRVMHVLKVSRDDCRTWQKALP